MTPQASDGLRNTLHYGYRRTAAVYLYRYCAEQRFRMPPVVPQSSCASENPIVVEQAAILIGWNVSSYLRVRCPSLSGQHSEYPATNVERAGSIASRDWIWKMALPSLY